MGRWSIVVAVAMAAVLAGACGPSNAKPAGTSSDPVTVCERIGDICRLDGSRLGVCTPREGTALGCAAQH